MNCLNYCVNLLKLFKHYAINVIMETGMRVGDLMTRDFVHVGPEVDLRECAKTMIKKRVGSLVIKEDGELRGILTEKDLVWAISKKSKKDLVDIKAKDLMRRKIIKIKHSADVTDAMEKFKEKKVRRLPVVERGKLIGIVTANDILRIDPGLFQIMSETIKIKEEAEKLKRSDVGTSQRKNNCEECGGFDVLYLDGAQWLCEECYSKR